ncbi:hypothetical protein HYDPIDRAFT_104787 [Hydnomerulius pinastri MD-312]|nr:hypothetical protein HYDPIDRAFT_104787 [Hydnomerulius pinastri MD-312]
MSFIMSHIPVASTSTTISCQWDWCRLTFSSLDALETHVKHDHVWPMKPMRRTDIALMKRLDAQSFHSTPNNTESSNFSAGPVVTVSEEDPSMPGTRTPSRSMPLTPSSWKHKDSTQNKTFSTFGQLSSPAEILSPPSLPASPALETLVRRGGRSSASAAVERFERTHNRQANSPSPLSSRKRSPTFIQHSQSSTSSKDAVEQHLTQDDEMESPHKPLQPPSSKNPLPENEVADTELLWPGSDDEGDEPAALPAGAQISSQPQPPSSQNHLSFKPSPGRGQRFRHGFLGVPLTGDGGSIGPVGHTLNGSSDPRASQESHSFPQPFALQTQASYFSQNIDWSQSQ